MAYPYTIRVAWHFFVARRRGKEGVKRDDSLACRKFPVLCVKQFPHLCLIHIVLPRRPASASTCAAQATIPSAPLRALPSAHLPTPAAAAVAAQAPAAPATTSATIASLTALARPSVTPMAEPTIAPRYGRTALPTPIHTCSLMYSPHLSAQA